MSVKSKKPFKACTKCKFLTLSEEEKCPNCGSTTFTDEWDGIAIILDPERSEVARILGITKPGRYAIKIGS